jgi:DNA polymerase IV
MPAAEALRRCPDAIFIRPRFETYRAVSAQIFAIYRQATPQVEPLSLDEAYLDVSDYPSATLLARELKQRIRAVTGLTASAGVSVNKFLAKIASDMDKPDGLTVIRPEEVDAFVAGLPVRRFFGVGPATEARMKGHGILTGADLRSWTRDRLVEVFGKSGYHYWHIARGIDERPVQASRVRKSWGAERTFSRDMLAPADMLTELQHLYEQVTARPGDKEARRENADGQGEVQRLHADHAQPHPGRGPGDAAVTATAA